MPSKIIQPVDSLVSIASEILRIIQKQPIDIDNLYELANRNYSKKISFEKFVLALDFLYLIQKIELNNEIIKIRI